MNRSLMVDAASTNAMDFAPESEPSSDSGSSSKASVSSVVCAL